MIENTSEKSFDFFEREFSGCKDFLINLTPSGPKILRNSSILELISTKDSIIISIEQDSLYKKNVIIFNKLKKKYTIESFNGGLMPLFYRQTNSDFHISNSELLLINTNDTIEVSTQILFSKIIGDSNTLYSIFINILRFQDSCIFEYNFKDVTLMSSSIKISKKKSPEESYSILKNIFSRFNESNIIIPLSGGYDSRLIASFFSKDASNIKFIHEYKNEKELNIAQQVSKYFNNSIELINRDIDKNLSKKLSKNKVFLKYISTNRLNLIRWIIHFKDIDLASTRIIGFAGAEPHKGKYYESILDINNDPFKIFSINKNKVENLLSILGIKNYEDFQGNELYKWINQAKELSEDITKQIDYVHYHSYICNSYGFRTYAFSKIFNIHYPNLDSNFLNSVFSLSSKDKISGSLIKTIINNNDPNLNKIEYYSGNKKTFGKGISFYKKFSNKIKSFVKPNIKGSKGICALVDEEPQSSLTNLILKLIIDHPSYISSDQAILIYNMLRILENEKNVKFQLK